MTAALALLTAAALGQAPANANANATSVRLAAGAQLGMPHLVGLVARATLLEGGTPRWDADLAWEPSWFLQSYSLAASWRPAGSIFFVGPRVRLLQFHAPWERGFRLDTDSSLGLGAEAGARIPVGFDQRLVLSASVQGTWVPAQAQSFQGLFGANVGVTWTFGEAASR